jgi:hypothetical protein
MKNLRYICVQPRILYYAWQVEVMINNFLKNGISGNDIDILVAWNPNDGTSAPEAIEAWNKLAQKYNYVRFFWYQDTRTDMSYIPSVYFNIMKQHIAAFPELITTPLFLHDSDTIFTKPVDFSSMLNDNIWYLSDTIGYIGTQYILTKGEDVYKGMCDIIGIDPLIPKLLNSNSGGAQHIVKGTTYEYWDKVEKDSIALYKHLCNIEHLHSENQREGYPIQKWTAGMWSLLWNAWLFGNETKVDSRLDFCWATDSIERWNEVSIYHNAGVTCACERQFYKAAYTNEYPYNINQDTFSSNKASYNYVKEIIETANKSCLI